MRDVARGLALDGILPQRHRVVPGSGLTPSQRAEDDDRDRGGEGRCMRSAREQHACGKQCEGHAREIAVAIRGDVWTRLRDPALAIAILDDAPDELVLFDPAHPPDACVDVVRNEFNSGHV